MDMKDSRWNLCVSANLLPWICNAAHSVEFLADLNCSSGNVVLPLLLPLYLKGSIFYIMGYVLFGIASVKSTWPRVCNSHSLPALLSVFMSQKILSLQDKKFKKKKLVTLSWYEWHRFGGQYLHSQPAQGADCQIYAVCINSLSLIPCLVLSLRPLALLISLHRF